MTAANKNRRTHLRVGPICQEGRVLWKFACGLEMSHQEFWDDDTVDSMPARLVSDIHQFNYCRACLNSDAFTLTRIALAKV